MRCAPPPPRNLMRWMAALVKIDRPMRVDSTGSLSGGDRLLIVLRSLSRRWPTGSIGQEQSLAAFCQCAQEQSLGPPSPGAPCQALR